MSQSAGAPRQWLRQKPRRSADACISLVEHSILYYSVLYPPRPDSPLKGITSLAEGPGAAASLFPGHG